MYCSYFTEDRSGAQLINILQNYYYCYINDLIYGGPIKKNIKKNIYHYEVSITETNKLIDFLNIPFEKNQTNYKIIDEFVKENEYKKGFFDVLHNQVKPNLKLIHKQLDDFIVCLHVRRGDVQKDNRWSMRYTDDMYYFELINEIKKLEPNAKIYLFSENNFKNEENYNKYIELGCIMMLDTSLEEAFNYFIQCDIFIMASSAFSHIPAMYKKYGLIIYTWSKYFTPLNHWIDSNDINYKKKSIKEFIEREKPFTCKKCYISYRKLDTLKCHVCSN